MLHKWMEVHELSLMQGGLKYEFPTRDTSPRRIHRVLLHGISLREDAIHTLRNHYEHNPAVKVICHQIIEKTNPVPATPRHFELPIAKLDLQYIATHHPKPIFFPNPERLVIEHPGEFFEIQLLSVVIQRYVLHVELQAEFSEFATLV